MESTSKPASVLRAQWAKSFAPAERTLPAMLIRQAERYGNKPLVSVGDTTWSYADACDTAARFAAALRDAGVKAGDRVAVICSNRIEFLEPDPTRVRHFEHIDAAQERALARSAGPDNGHDLALMDVEPHALQDLHRRG